MTTKNARLKRRCKDKASYNSKEQADKNYYRTAQNTVFMLKVYKCKICKKWHLGRDKKIYNPNWKKLVNF